MSDVVVIETASGPVSLERSGTGPHLIMLHSLLSDRHVFDPVLSELGTRWTVNLIDLPGFGSTELVGSSIDAYAASSAPSLTMFARSAPLRPGVLRARTSALTSSESRGIFRR